ncbi:hypothetical protein WN944_029624 [Citrus x changshan-huyou]|uniref:Uncharacterized protein n=1 Tax=Citrus x changshan-huyou TaxID=2935761 RepID=A0AAP0LMD3_9ROSI
MFIIRTELDASPVLLEKNDNEETLPDQFSVSQDTELDWFDLAGVDEFALPDLNAKVTAGAGCSNSNVVVLEGDKENGNTTGESINASSNVNVPDRENNMDDLESDDQRETGACAGDAAVANDVVSTQNSVHENGIYRLSCVMGVVVCAS